MRIDRIVSLGGKCEVAYQARRLMGAERAYPFDWWTVPVEAIAPNLRSRFEETFKVEHLTKIASPDRGTILKSLYGGTTHPHEFRFGEDIVPYDLGDISRRLTDKYAFLSARFYEDCGQGRTLFVRQSVWHDPQDGATLEPLVGDIAAAIADFCPDWRLLLLDYDPDVSGDGRILQRRVVQYEDAANLGSAKGWDEMIASLPLTFPRQKGRARVADLQESDPRPPTLLKRIGRRFSAFSGAARAAR